MPLIPLTLLLALTLQAGKPAPQTTRARGGTLDVRVTDRTGATLDDVVVKAEGDVSREGTTNSSGFLALTNMTAGTYRLRFEREGFVTLEKEAAVRAGATVTVNAALTAAPPPPPPPEPAAPPPPPAPVLTAGEPRVVAIPDFVNRQLISNKETIKENPIGCSGATETKVLQLRAPLAAQTHADADEVLYVIAGDATIRLGADEHRINSGSLVLVPRGIEHTITPRGRNPLILTSALSGMPCK
jgi:mannose-6-phosphate isomerase-like protein (cupin superfamily)